MKNKYFNILIIIVLLLSLSLGSCQDYFKIQRPQEVQWTTTATFEQGLNKCYINVGWTTAGGKGYPAFLDFLLSGVAMLSPGTAVGQQGEPVLNRVFIRNGIYREVWNTGYNTIALSNLAIDMYENDPEGNPLDLNVKGSDYTNNYLRQIGEYHFVRGYTYFWLMKMFAPRYIPNGDNSATTIPLNVTTATTMEQIHSQKVGTVEEVYQQVIDDLKYAKENLPDKFVLNGWNNVPGYECGRANKWVATAMLGKVYWLMGRYKEAKVEFDALINYAETTGTYQLKEPRDPFIQARAWNVPKESIWEFNSGYLEGESEAHNCYLVPGRNMGFRNRDSNGHELETSPLVGVGTTLGGYGGGVAVTIGYTTLKKVGWMADPLNGDYTVTPKAAAD
ncbi:MAG TPA: RagB/SusD family nutrient uptake outer membrane protein, partial [Prolixibacteraceae bacterium]